jgi:serine/threonine protein kinase
MPKQILIISGPDKGRLFPIPDAEPLLIGRSKATQTRLSDPHVSRVHCQILLEGEQVVVSDFESASGTFINDKRITQQVLKDGDVLRIGETQLRIQAEDTAETETVVPAASTATKPSPVSREKLAELEGKTLAHYEVGPVLARSRSGLVFRARDPKEGRDVALKVLWPEFSKNEEEMQRFIRAMKTMLPLRHVNLVTLYGAGKTGPLCWIAMEYVEGESATQVIQRIGTANMLDWRYALRVAVHVGRALDFAHRQQILHRNITPHNILIQSSDKLTKLGDLMMAKALEGTLAEQITRPGELVGDVHYMSPERTRGNPAEVDGRSDLYSLGAATYALLTGRPPFEGDSLPDTIAKIRQAEPVKPKKYQLSIPDLFEASVLQMLAKRPADRFQTAGDMLEQLERVAKYHGVAV